MAYTTPLYSTLNAEGVDLSTAFTLSTSTPEYPAAPFILGTQMLGTLDGAWVYCTAAGAVTLGDVCVINKSFSSIELTSATAATYFGMPLGVSMATVTTGQYSWYQTNGISQSINVAASIAPNVQLYTTATGGRLGAIATGVSSTVIGIVTTTTSNATAGTYPGVIRGAYISTAN